MTDHHQLRIDDRRKDAARQFLNIHKGRCSVLADSPMGLAFALLGAEGEVTLNESGTAGYVDARRIEFLGEEGDL